MAGYVAVVASTVADHAVKLERDDGADYWRRFYISALEAA